MTNEEAIQELKSDIEWSKLNTYPYISQRKVEALEMAIKALEQEPEIGQWEWVQYDSNPHIGNWHCSKCRKIIVYGVTATNTVYTSKCKYCPKCGCRMI